MPLVYPRATQHQSAGDRVKASKLLDGYLEGLIPVEAYRTKSAEIAEQRAAFERRLLGLGQSSEPKTPQVEQLAKEAAGARLQFKQADDEGKRKVLSTVLLNATVLGAP